jgi:hypothetical protein
MTTAMMITSSPEDLNNLKITREIISFIGTVFDESNLTYVDYNGFHITKEDIQHVNEYYALMHNFLLNPGMNEEQFLNYEKETN